MSRSLRGKPSFLGLAAAVTARSCGLRLAGARLSALDRIDHRTAPPLRIPPFFPCDSKRRPSQHAGNFRHFQKSGNREPRPGVRKAQGHPLDPTWTSKRPRERLQGQFYYG